MDKKKAGRKAESSLGAKEKFGVWLTPEEQAAALSLGKTVQDGLKEALRRAEVQEVRTQEPESRPAVQYGARKENDYKYVCPRCVRVNRGVPSPICKECER